jgi:chaperone modulatory protein CbpM
MSYALTHISRITLLRVCRACRSEPGFVIDLVKAGVVRPKGARPIEWRFTPQERQRAEMAAYLWRRYGLNTEGVAFVMQLLDMNRMLREQLQALSLNI